MQAYITATGIGGLATSKNAITKAKGSLDQKFPNKAIAVYPFLGGTGPTNKFNVYAPTDLDTSFRLVYTGTPTHGAAGITFDGSSNRADTFIVPVADGLFDDTGMCVAWYSATNSVPSGAKYIWGCYPNDFCYFDASSVQGNLGNVNANFNTGGGINTSGVFLVNRAPNSGTVRLLKNNALIGSAASAFVSYADDKFTLGAIIDVATPFYAAINFGFMYIGKGLTTGQQETDMYNIINTYKTDMSR